MAESSAATLPRILFVDDEESVLRSLRASLRKFSKRWRLEFYVGGCAALDALEHEGADLVVTDMRMPGMDGATFLEHLRDLVPEAVRVVSSGEADEEMTARALPIAHRWLTKPCDRSELVATIEEGLAARSYWSESAVREIVCGTTGAVPALPRCCSEIVSRMQSPDSSVAELADLISRDPGVAAKVLQLANSVTGARRGQVTRLQDALGVVGLRETLSIILASGVLHVFRGDEEFDELSFSAIEERTELYARLLRQLLPGREGAASGGLFHDLGVLVMMRHDHAAYAEVLRAWGRSDDSLAAAERAVFGVTHADIGGAVLAKWGLPVDVVQCVARHHDPERWDGSAGAAALHTIESVIERPSGAEELLDRLREHGFETEAERWIEAIRTDQHRDVVPHD